MEASKAYVEFKAFGRSKTKKTKEHNFKIKYKNL